MYLFIYLYIFRTTSAFVTLSFLALEFMGTHNMINCLGSISVTVYINRLVPILCLSISALSVGREPINEQVLWAVAD